MPMLTRATLLALLVLSAPATSAGRVPQTPATAPAEEDIARAEQLIASAERAAAGTDTATARNLGKSALEIFERRQHVPGSAPSRPATASRGASRDSRGLMPFAIADSPENTG